MFMWNDFLGVTHADQKYAFGNEACLYEGASRIRELGSKTVKLWMGWNYKRMYSFNMDWKDHYSLVSLASDEYFKKVFGMDFNTFILETFPFSADCRHINWRTGFTEADRQFEFDGMYEFARYLLEAYKDTGKTFILQNWETDWAILDRFDLELEPEPEAVENCIKWINTRQEAVNKARQDTGCKGVNVYNALEVNHVLKAMSGKKSVTNSVIPNTCCDLYSYSAYDTSNEGTYFGDALDYLLGKIPKSEINGRANLYIGEFGLAENETSEDRVKKCISHVVGEADKRNLLHAVYWQLYDNEAVEGKSDEPGDCKGYWLIKPSGKKSVAWHYFYDLLNK